MIKTMFVLALLVAAGPSSACVDGKTGFLPENDLKIGVDEKFRNDMTEERFNEIIDRVDKHYRPIVKSKGGNLKWSRGWKNDTVNASAQRFFWTWKVNMYGGLARHPLTTDDGFALVVCHELGHHLGGAPKVGGFMSWASNEGQSDYFANLKCFRKVFESDNNEEIIAKMDVPATVREKCSANYSLENDVALCIRGAMAGKSLAQLLGSLRGNTDISFDTPDANVVGKTDNKHPAAQCRMDTFLQGAICDKRVSDEVSNDSATEGTCNRIEGYEDGVRPLCWFKPEGV